jgi:hypothetical protein
LPLEKHCREGEREGEREEEEEGEEEEERGERGGGMCVVGYCFTPTDTEAY